jgi:hypothetical protein
MLNGLRRAMGLQLARFRFRKGTDSILSFTRAFSDARTVLVVMPFDRSQLLNTVRMIDLLRKTFHEENITFVVGQSDHELRRMMPKSQFINVLESDITSFYLPRRTALEKIRSRTYDLALDLNLDFLLPSGYICKVSNARIRIGFARAHGDAFFNFQMRPGETGTAKDVHDRLVACLQMF